MNVFKKEMKAHFKSLLIWSFAQIFIIYAGMIEFNSFSDSQVDLNVLFDSLPKEVLIIFGMGTADLTQIAGFYSVFFLYFMLLAAIHASMFGAVSISREERDHNADFIYSKPIKRSQVILPKFLAGIINILIFNMVTFGASVFFIAWHNDGDGLFNAVSLTMLALFIFQLFFLALGAMFGSLLKNTKAATSASSGLILSFFLISVAVDLFEDLAFLKIITPFQYFKGDLLMVDQQLPAFSFLILIIASCLLFGLSLLAFQRRDLRT